LNRKQSKEEKEQKKNIHTTAAGKSGPRKKPTHDTATAETTNCGTSQNSSSRPMARTK
jgi:hypothetical protein